MVFLACIFYFSMLSLCQIQIVDLLGEASIQTQDAAQKHREMPMGKT